MPAPSLLMKSAKQYGRPVSAAQPALAGDEPSSQTSGTSGRPGSVFARSAKAWPGGQVVREIAEQLGQLVREVIRARLPPVALQRVRRPLIAPRRAPDAEVDPPRIEPGERREGLGDLERRIMRQHDPAAAQPDARGDRPGGGEQYFRRGPGERRGAMVLRRPVAVIAEPVADARKIDAVRERGGRGRAVGDRRLVEDAEAAWRVSPEAT